MNDKFYYKTYISKSMFGKDSFVVGPSKVYKKLDTSEYAVTESAIFYNLVDADGEIVGSLIKRVKPLPVCIISLTEEDYYEITVNSTNVSIFSLCNKVDDHIDDEYLETLKKYLYNTETDLIPWRELKGDCKK